MAMRQVQINKYGVQCPPYVMEYTYLYRFVAQQ